MLVQRVGKELVVAEKQLMNVAELAAMDARALTGQRNLRAAREAPRLTAPWATAYVESRVVVYFAAAWHPT